MQIYSKSKLHTCLGKNNTYIVSSKNKRRFSFLALVRISSYCYLFSLSGRFGWYWSCVAGGFGLAILTLGFGLPVGEIQCCSIHHYYCYCTCIPITRCRWFRLYDIYGRKILRKNLNSYF